MVDTTVFVSMQSGTVINLLKLTPRCIRISEGAAINGVITNKLGGRGGGGVDLYEVLTPTGASCTCHQGV